MSSKAWAIAASDLGIRVSAPFHDTDRFGQPLEFVAHVMDFGSSRGTLVWYMPEPLPTRRIRLNSPHFISALNPDIYADYDRERFVALLSAWGWTGQGDAPSWYLGD